MAYKVCLVEDEIVTREGIRDNVNWEAHGFEFRGEASDGETAWPLLQTVRPHVLITDIKMPFMDGLQLCKLVRERLPDTKIVILSGHDEFKYAQQAIELGVTEYLLKPITVQDLHNMLRKLAARLEQERIAEEDRRQLRDQVEENRTVLRERFLLKLVIGALSSMEAIENSHQLGLDLTARGYLVVIVKIEPADCPGLFNYDAYQKVQQAIEGLIANNPDVFWLTKNWEERVLIIKGETPEYLEEEKDLLAELIRRLLKPTGYQLTLGVGTPKKHLADIHQSFVEALAEVQKVANAGRASFPNGGAQAEWLKVNKAAVDNYLRCGRLAEFDHFFEVYLQPLGETALKSYLIKNYLFGDIVLATAQFLHAGGGALDQVIPELGSIETILANINTLGQLKEQARTILSGALAFRDSQANRLHTGAIRQAKDYMARHFANADLSLNEVAVQVNLSSSHFSTIFGQETHQSFKEYLTGLRIQKAKELLRTTGLRSAEIAYQVGYSDPHYFSSVFKKQTGLSPTEYREQPRGNLPGGELGGNGSAERDRPRVAE